MTTLREGRILIEAAVPKGTKLREGRILIESAQVPLTKLREGRILIEVAVLPVTPKWAVGVIGFPATATNLTAGGT